MSHVVCNKIFKMIIFARLRMIIQKKIIPILGLYILLIRTLAEKIKHNHKLKAMAY